MAISLERVGRNGRVRKMGEEALAIQPTITQAGWRDLSYYSDTSIAHLARIGLLEE